MVVRLLASFCLLLLAAAPAAAQVDIEILYLERQTPKPPVLSNLDPEPEDSGLMGARLAIQDNATTGRFLKHNYSLTEVIIGEEEDFLAEARPALAASKGLIVIHAPASDVLALADLPEATDRLIFNGTAPDDELRRDACRANVFHTIPSRAMLTDALAQFLVKKRWNEWFIIEGDYDDDKAYAAAVKRSATKFQASVEAEKIWKFDADMRRNASREVPLFTQGVDHDVLIIADEREDFGRYVLYNTWDPRPVAGTEGLSPKAWAPVVEQWGAAQLQSRFEKLAERSMTSEDYGTWAAIRSIGEAVTRTGKADAATVRAFLLSDKFNLAGFKGRKLSFRDWNGQLRQPIPIVHPRALVALAPLEGFLHQRTELDTLGFDKPEANCTAFN